MINHIELAKECGLVRGDYDANGYYCETLHGDADDLRHFANAIIDQCANAADEFEHTGAAIKAILALKSEPTCA